MYRVDRNNFYDEQKNSTIYTPAPVSEFLFKILSDKIDKKGLVVDPCVGAGSFLDPFRREGFSTIGIDIEDQGFPQTIICNFLEMKKGKIGTPSLVIANPPFNIDEKTKDIVARSLGRRPLLPEAWLSKIIQLWGGANSNCFICPLRTSSQPNCKQPTMEIVCRWNVPGNFFYSCLAKGCLRRCFISQRDFNFQCRWLERSLFFQWLNLTSFAPLESSTNPKTLNRREVTRPFTKQWGIVLTTFKDAWKNILEATIWFLAKTCLLRN